jgi:hypothetical protein
LAVAERKVLAQLPRFPSGARLRRRFSIMHPERERNTPQFLQEFFTNESTSPEVSDDQVIAQAIKALCARPLHNHLVRERPKTMPQLYEQFAKFSKSEIQHFRKLEQQRKVSKADKAPRPHHNESQHSYPKPVHSIDSVGCGPWENWGKNYGMSSQETSHSTTSDQRFSKYNPGETSS